MRNEIFSLLTLVVTGINIILGIIVLIRKIKNINNIVYAYVAFSISSWTLATHFYNNPLFFDSTIWLKIVYVVSYLMLISEGLFVYTFPRKIPEKFWTFFGLILLTIIPSAYVLLFTDSVVVSTTNYANLHISIATMGPMYIVYMIPNLLGTLFLSLYFFRKSKWFSGHESSQIKIYMIVSLVMFIPILIFDYMVPLIWGNTELYIFGPVFVIAYTSGVAYSMLKNRFFEVKSILEKFLDLVISSLFLGVVIYIIGMFARNFFKRDISTDLFIIILLSPLSVLIFLTGRKIIKRLIYQTLGSSQFNRQQILSNLSKEISRKLDIVDICVLVSDSIKGYIKKSTVEVILVNKQTGRNLFSAIKKIDEQEAMMFLDVVQHTSDEKVSNILILDELKHRFEDEQAIELGGLIDFMNNYKLSSVLLLNQITNVIGAIFIINSSQSDNYTSEDVAFLQNILNNATVSIERALLYKDVKEFNDTLKQKVDEATREITEQRDAIAEQLRKEKDMMDILGHELRTPLSIARNAIAILDMEIKKDPSETLPKQKVKETVDWAMENIRREVKLLETVLSSTRIENDRLQLTITDVDCIDVVNDTVDGLKETAIAKKLKLNAEVPNAPLTIKGDRERIQEILFNLTDNAIKYTQTGGVTVKVEDSVKEIKFSVIDTGEGIPKDDIPKLGKKFYRVNPYSESSEDDEMKIIRPGGTGIGLYVVFNLVKMMNGRIEIQSEVGKGSEFAVYLPK